VSTVERRRSDERSSPAMREERLVVGDTGIEPVTSSVSRKREPVFCCPLWAILNISVSEPWLDGVHLANYPFPVPHSRSGRPVGVGRPLQGLAKRELLLGDERVLAFFLGLLVHPNDGAFAFAVELGFHGALLRLIHRTHVITLLRDAPLVTVFGVRAGLVRVRDVSCRVCVGVECARGPRRR
jgi:hypothetical protein